MLKRFSLRSLVLLAVFLVSFAHLLWNGRHATKVALENLPTPHWRTGRSLAAYTRPTGEPGRTYDLTFTPPAEGDPEAPRGAHLMVQLATLQTRILVVRQGHPNTSVSWLDVLRGRDRLQILPDRGWVDLGELPSGGEPLRAQVVGILPSPYGFYEIYTDGPGDRAGISRVRISRPESPRARPLKILPRTRFVVPAPVPASEVLARYFFFFGASPVLAVFGCLSVALLFAGWFWLGEGEERRLRAVCCLVPGVILLHATCLPPLEGADETSHVPTIEALVYRDAIPKAFDPYPTTLESLTLATGHRASAFNPEVPLRLTSAPDRARAREVLALTSRPGDGLKEDADRDGDIETVDSRSPLFFRPYALLAPLFRALSLIDRVSLYRLLATAAGCLLFALAARTAARLESIAGGAALALIALVPQVVFVTASCSNYAPAIGAGFLFAVLLLVSVLAGTDAHRRRARLLLLVGALVGIPLWPDCILLAIATLYYVLAFEVWNRFASAAARSAGLAAAAAVLAAVAWAVTRLKFGNIGNLHAILVPRWGEMPFAPMLGMALLPSLFGLLAAALALRTRESSAEGSRRLFRLTSLALVAAAFLLFVLTPFSRTSTDTWLPFPEYAERWMRTLASTSFSWDQDFLAFKSFCGVFGWLDGFYPDWVYAAARWGIAFGVMTLPMLARRFVAAQPTEAAILFAAAGVAGSLACITEVIRLLVHALTVGRFILPYYPLILAPILVAALGRSRLAAPALRLAVGLQVWTAIALLGSRYALGM